jgi:hypothetical protein
MLVASLTVAAGSAGAAPEFVQRAPLGGAGKAPASWFSRALEAAAPSTTTECEYFLLAPEASEGDGAARPTGGGLALIAQRRVARRGDVLLEREVLFEEGGLRVLHTERIKGDRRTLTYREIQPSGARTWRAEWDAVGGRARVLGHGWHRPTHETFVAPAHLMGPLELLEQLRSGNADASAQVLDPLAATVSQLEVEVLPGTETNGPTLRATRPDGTHVLEFGTLDGTRELAFLRFTSGQRVASAIGEQEYERRFELWNRPRVPSHERVRAWFFKGR